jgi:hypothetical protein
LDELDENQMIQKFQSLEILKDRVTRQKIHLKNHFIKKLLLMGSKCLALDAGHMCTK